MTLFKFDSLVKAHGMVWKLTTLTGCGCCCGGDNNCNLRSGNGCGDGRERRNNMVVVMFHLVKWDKGSVCCWKNNKSSVFLMKME